jgi:hypothetical protein
LNMRSNDERMAPQHGVPEGREVRSFIHDRDAASHQLVGRLVNSLKNHIQTPAPYVARHHKATAISIQVELGFV